MLKKHLTSTPPAKFITIQDTLKHTSKSLVRWLIGNHLKKGLKVHLFAFEGCTNGGRNRGVVDGVSCTPGVVLHDFSDDPNGWLNVGNKSFERELAGVPDGSVVVVDSLMHAVYYYGLAQLIGVIHKCLCGNRVLQLIGTLHGDLVDDPKVPQYLRHISTFAINLDGENRTRLKYTLKKPTGKIQNGVELYEITGGDLRTKTPEVSDSVVLDHHQQEILPESLTTFKITLDDKAKQSKEQLVLPYLPKKDAEETAKIVYEFDTSDDWDEEDPDDDLDI